jgi:flagellar hook assembly protein FlgD
MGREIVRIIDGQLNGGHHKFRWSGKHNSGRVASSGIYFYRLTAKDFQQTRKMLIIK